jgi:hypothetical protein
MSPCDRCGTAGERLTWFVFARKWGCKLCCKSLKEEDEQEKERQKEAQEKLRCIESSLGLGLKSLWLDE